MKEGDITYAVWRTLFKADAANSAIYICLSEENEMGSYRIAFDDIDVHHQYLAPLEEMKEKQVSRNNRERLI